jgi:hypothetical protein
MAHHHFGRAVLIQNVRTRHDSERIRHDVCAFGHIHTLTDLIEKSTPMLEVFRDFPVSWAENFANFGGLQLSKVLINCASRYTPKSPMRIDE